MAINRKSRSDIKGQQPRILWFTGLSAAGKSTIANLVDIRLHALGKHTYLLDGDNILLGLNRDLGFTGIDSPYEPPEDPEIRIDTTVLSAEEAADRIVGFLKIHSCSTWHPLTFERN